MMNVGGGEILVVLLVALLFLGPDKLPGVAKQAGGFLREARRMSQNFQNEMRSTMDLSQDSSNSKVETTENSPTETFFTRPENETLDNSAQASRENKDTVNEPSELLQTLKQSKPTHDESLPIPHFEGPTDSFL